MAEVWFYQLDRQPLEAVLPRMIAGIFARGHRVSIHVRDRSFLEKLSASLWTIDETSFIPHGFSTDRNATLVPIVLCTDEVSTNTASYRFCADGIVPNDTNFERLSLFFDGIDAEALTNARQQWKEFRNTGHTIRYWKQSESGKWEDQAMKQAA
jgi:DNA polymerase III subunit chi